MTLKYLLPFATCLALTLPVQAEVIANFREDFSAGSPGAGWSYLWNPAKAPIELSEAYTELEMVAAGKLSVDAGTEPGLNGPMNGRWLNITRHRWMPGDPPGRAEDGLSHYVIAAYTIQDGEAGSISIRGSKAQCTGMFSGSQLKVFLNTAIQTSLVLDSKAAFSFDGPLGELVPGDTVYIAYGPSDTHSPIADIQFTLVRE